MLKFSFLSMSASWFFDKKLSTFPAYQTRDVAYVYLLNQNKNDKIQFWCLSLERSEQV